MVCLCYTGYFDKYEICRQRMFIQEQCTTFNIDKKPYDIETNTYISV